MYGWLLIMSVMLIRGFVLLKKIVIGDDVGVSKLDSLRKEVNIDSSSMQSNR